MVTNIFRLVHEARPRPRFLSCIPTEAVRQIVLASPGGRLTRMPAVPLGPRPSGRSQPLLLLFVTAIGIRPLGSTTSVQTFDRVILAAAVWNQFRRRSSVVSTHTAETLASQDLMSRNSPPTSGGLKISFESHVEHGFGRRSKKRSKQSFFLRSDSGCLDLALLAKKKKKR